MQNSNDRSFPNFYFILFVHVQALYTISQQFEPFCFKTVLHSLSLSPTFFALNTSIRMELSTENEQILESRRSHVCIVQCAYMNVCVLQLQRYGRVDSAVTAGLCMFASYIYSLSVAGNFGYDTQDCRISKTQILTNMNSNKRLPKTAGHFQKNAGCIFIALVQRLNVLKIK